MTTRVSGLGYSNDHEMAEQQDYENELVFQRNRLLPRAYWIPETSIVLNGEWEFHYARNPAHAPQPKRTESKAESTNSTSSWATSELTTSSLSSDGNPPWTSIIVPGHWQLQGFGRPQYTNVVYPFPVSPPRVPSENPTGSYRRRFTIPKNWDANSQLRLRFDGVDSAYHVWVNGELVGYHQGSRNPGEFEITSLVDRDGINEVLVRVYQWSDGSYIEDQDQWWLSGIFRDVYVLAFPGDSRIEDYSVTTSFDGDFQNADLDLTVNVNTKASVKLSMDLLDVNEQNFRLVSETITVNHAAKFKIRASVNKPHKWTAEDPYLYKLVIELGSDSSKLRRIQKIEAMIGFRQVEIKGGHLLVNGKRIILQGVNRHDHHPKFGRAVPLSFIRQDLLLMKQHNINALRCSHYPPNPKMLDICDELGFWVMNEADLECHGFYDAVARPLNIPEDMDYEKRKLLTFAKAGEYTSNNPKWRGQYLDRAENLVQRDKNHPSVIMWSLGNESFYGQNHKVMYDYIKSVDPTRPVHYEGDSQAASADVFSYMYPSTRKLLELSRTEGVVNGRYEKPMILCEYAHAMGNGPGNLEGYQALFKQHGRLQGGFIWEWANHGLWKDDGDKQFYAYGGDFNDFPNDGTFVMDGLCFSNHKPTPGLIEYKKVIAPVMVSMKRQQTIPADGVELVIENHYDFSDLSHLNATFKVEAFNARVMTLQSGSFELPDIQASQSKSIRLPLKSVDHITDAEVWLTLRFHLKDATHWAEVGHEIAWSQMRLDHTSKVDPVGGIRNLTASVWDLHLQESLLQWTISNDVFELQFDRTSGGISSWKFRDKQILLSDANNLNAITPTFWRPPTDNDMPRNNPYWKNFGLDVMKTQLRSMTIKRIASGDFEISSHIFSTPPILDWGYDCKIVYVIARSGAIRTKVKLGPKGKKPAHIPRIGLELRVAKDFSAAKYFGCGPGESYPDKQSSQQIGIYQSHVNELFVNYDVPQENGNRMDARYLQLWDERSSILLEALRPNATFSWAVHRYTSDQIEKARHPCDLKEDDALTLRLDFAVAGVGSGACGPDVLDEHRVKCEDVEFEFELRCASRASI